MTEHKCARCKEKVSWREGVFVTVTGSDERERYELCYECYLVFKDNFLRNLGDVRIDTLKQRKKGESDDNN